MEACLAQPCRFAAGLQKNAQALQRMLKCPLLYRSSKPRLDAFQKHYVPKERRVRGPPHLLACASGPSGSPRTAAAVTTAFGGLCSPSAPQCSPARCCVCRRT